MCCSQIEATVLLNFSFSFLHMTPIHQERLQVGILKLKVTCYYLLRYHRSVYEEHLVSSLSCCCAIIIRNHDTRTPFLVIYENYTTRQQSMSSDLVR